MGATTQISPAVVPERYILQQASCRASHLVSKAGFLSDDWDDLRQDMALDCLQRIPRFDPDRGEWPAFVRGVIRNRSAVLITKRRNRKQREESLFAEAHFGEPEADLGESHSFEPTGSLNLRLDIDRVLSTLPPKLRTLAVQLEEMSVAEIAAEWGKSTTWIYFLLDRLRQALREAGITPASPAHYGGAR